MIILGIESSCDETAVSICKGGKILSNIVSSQQIHNDYGGVVPEVAAREHDRLLNHLIIFLFFYFSHLFLYQVSR